MRTLSPVLVRCLERANPNVASFVEISSPDQEAVMRRRDQFTGAPLLSQTPPSSLAVSSATGALELTSVADEIISQYVEAGFFNIPQELGGNSYINGSAWTLDQAFPGGVLRRVQVRLKWINHIIQSSALNPDVMLRVIRIQRQAGTFVRKTGTSTVKSQGTETTFVDLLPQPIVASYAKLNAIGVIDGAGFADVSFDLTPYRIEIDPAAPAPAGPDETQFADEIYFVIQTNQQMAGNMVEWRFDNSSARVIAGIGNVREKSWTRDPDDPNSTWTPSEAVNRALCIKVEIDSFPTDSVAVYQLDLPALPASNSIGRVVFNRGVPRDTSATLELSTAGSGGPWTGVASGDLVATHQLTYHMRLSLNASADARRSPTVSSFGIEFRQHTDLSVESSVEHMSQEIEVPFCKASIGEGRVTVVRTGRRDYHDPGADLVTAGADTKLELDIFLASRHPTVVRDDWFLMTRASVSARTPTPTAEQFSLLSISKLLKRKVPAQIESVNAVFTVFAASTTQIQVTGQLPGASATGNEYADKGYYIIIRKTAASGFAVGNSFTIDGNSNIDTLDFTSDELPGVLNAGDEIEVHSGQFVQPALTYHDWDPADVWWDVLTNLLQVPEHRIGFAGIGGASNSGLPPTLADRSDDPDEQDTLRVTFKSTSAENGDELLDQLSFLMGGATVEIGGQIVFRQIYPLKDASGGVRVHADAPSLLFDARDYTALETPTGREQRIPVLSCPFGADPLAAEPESTETVTSVDADALALYGLQDVDGISTAEVPSEISRWCYNSADRGQRNASDVSNRVVAASSTGVRPWSWTSIEAKPNASVGDFAVLVTDQYTDYDPATRQAIAGWKAYTLVIIGVSDGGRRFRGFLPGLSHVAAHAGLRSGLGTKQSHKRPALSHFTWEDPDDLTRVYTWERSTNTHAVWVYNQLVAIGEVDGYTDGVSLPAAVLPVGSDTYTADKPPQGFQRYLHFEPRDEAGTPGDVVNFIIDPAASALAGTVKAAVTNGAADLTLHIDGAASNWPVTVELYEDNPDGVPILETIVSASTTFTAADFPMLGSRPLPLREVRRWYMKLTDVAGTKVWGIGSADRDALPNGNVTRADYRADPILRATYDDDTDNIRITLPDSRTKTFGPLSGSGEVEYSVGDVLDDASVETPLATDEVRTPYLVEFQGGGNWVTFFNGPLHGVSSKPPVAHPRVVLSANRDTADVYVEVESPIAEKVRLYVRDAEGGAAPEYGLCVGVADPTPLYVTHGTELGPTSYFTAGAGQLLKLAAIPLVRDQIKRLYFVVEGQDSGLTGTAQVALSTKEQPWLESVSATWNAATGQLQVTAKGGANCASALFEIDDNTAFSSPYTATSALADGARVTSSFSLSGAERGKVWYARVTPYNAIALGGLSGVAQQDEAEIPALVTYTIAPSEAFGTGTLTVVLNDPGAKVDPSLRVSFAITQLGSRSTVLATTSPGGGATTGTYTYSFSLDEKHTTLIEPLIHMADGSTLKPGGETFDADKIANVVNADVVHVGAVATITAVFDTDTRTGASGAEYSVDGGAWTALTVNATTRVASFTVAMSTSATQSVRIRGIDSTGTAGPYVTVTVGIVASSGPKLDVRIEITSTDYIFHVDTDPAATVYERTDPATSYTSVAVGDCTITVPRDATNPTPFSLKAIDGAGVESNPVFSTVVEAQSAGTAAVPGFSAVSFAGTPDYVNNQIDISWVPDNPPTGATYNVTVWEQRIPSKPTIGDTTEFVGVGSPPYTFQADHDLDGSGSFNERYKAYVSMIDGATVVAISSTVEAIFTSND